jgi:origin recognition complex subunit 2
VAADEQPHGGDAGGEEVAVEYRMVYNKAVEEFICSSEMAFRTLLKEYVSLSLSSSQYDGWLVGGSKRLTN